MQQYKVIESSIIDSMQSLDNIFSNEFCEVGILQQEKVIKRISQELERLKDTLEQNKLDFLERQAKPTSFEYGKTHKNRRKRIICYSCLATQGRD